MQRKTKQREVIREVFDRAAHPLTAQEVLEAAELPGLGIATVYRCAKALCEEGWLTTVELSGEPVRFEVSDLKHHHHFRCDACARVFDVPGCPRSLEKGPPEGFQVERHEVIFYGKCAECAAESSSGSRRRGARLR